LSARIGLDTFTRQIFLFSEHCAIIPLFQRSEVQHGTDINTRAAAQRSRQGRAEKADFCAAPRSWAYDEIAGERVSAEQVRQIVAEVLGGGSSTRRRPRHHGSNA
jgi:hypothetical protein